MQFSLWRLAARCITRPHLLALLPGAAWRFRARGWWRHPPFLPLPPAEYVRWRLHTAFGNEQAEPDLDDLETYLKWAARMQKESRREARSRRGA